MYTWQLQLMYSLHTVEENRVYTFYLNKSRAWTVTGCSNRIDTPLYNIVEGLSILLPYPVLISGLLWSGCIQVCLELELIIIENTTIVEISSYFLSIWNKVLGLKGLTTLYRILPKPFLECKSPRDCYLLLLQLAYPIQFCPVAVHTWSRSGSQNPFMMS